MTKTPVSECQMKIDVLATLTMLNVENVYFGYKTIVTQLHQSFGHLG